MRTAFFLIGMTSIALSSCVESFTAVDPLPKKSVAGNAWERIEMVDLDSVGRPYDVIGQVRGDAWLDDARKLKKKAARLQADAITVPKNLGGGWIGALAIRYKDTE